MRALVQRAFTLIELLVVVAIIALLILGGALPPPQAQGRCGSVFCSKYLDRLT